MHGLVFQLFYKNRLTRRFIYSMFFLCHFINKKPSNKMSEGLFLSGVPGAIRTPDPRLRRALLYPAELQAHIFLENNGAGEGNRTLVTSLEGWRSTIELHPHC